MGHRFRACSCRGQRFVSRGENTVTVAQLGFEQERMSLRFQVRKEARNVNAGVVAEHVFRPGEDIFQIRAGHEPEGNIAVNAAESKVINVASKGRNIGALAGIELHDENIFSVEIEVKRQVERERSVSAFVFAKPRAVDPYGRSRHGATEIYENVTPACCRWQAEAPPIDLYEAIRLLIKAVPRQPLVGVGDRDLLET